MTPLLQMGRSIQWRASGVGIGTASVPYVCQRFARHVHNSIRLFADDLQIWAEIWSAEDSDSLQRSNLWLLTFNPSKCKSKHIAHKLETSYKVHQDKLAKTEEDMKVSAQCSRLKLQQSWCKYSN